MLLLNGLHFPLLCARIILKQLNEAQPCDHSPLSPQSETHSPLRNTGTRLWAQTGQRTQTPRARGHIGDGGGPSGRSRQCVGPKCGGAAACRLTIRLPEHPDGDGRCRLREPQVGSRAIKTASRVVDCTSPNAGSAPLRWPSSTWRPSASCSNGSPRGKTSQTPS